MVLAVDLRPNRNKVIPMEKGRSSPWLEISILMLESNLSRLPARFPLTVSDDKDGITLR